MDYKLLNNAATDKYFSIKDEDDDADIDSDSDDDEADDVDETDYDAAADTFAAQGLCDCWPDREFCTNDDGPGKGFCKTCQGYMAEEDC